MLPTNPKCCLDSMTGICRGSAIAIPHRRNIAFERGQIRTPMNFPTTQRIFNQIPDRERFGMQQTDRIPERSRNGRQ
jgi:hypothetical protein